MHSGSLSNRFFAWRISRFSAIADAALNEIKRDAFGPAFGRVLDVGAGSGVNLRYLPTTCCSIALEQNPFLQSNLRERYTEFCEGTAEAIELPDCSIDTIISSLVLCSVNDVPRAIAEFYRVLRVGGNYCFVEHVPASVGSTRWKLQRLLSPISQLVSDGCCPDRDITPALFGGGFSIKKLQRATVRGADPLVIDYLYGALAKP